MLRPFDADIPVCEQSFFFFFPLSLDKNAGFDGQEGIALEIKGPLA